MHPIAQRLPVHRADLGGNLAILPIKHRRQRQQPPRLIHILRPLRQLPQFPRTEVRAQWHRRTHDAPRESIPLARHRITTVSIRETPISESNSMKLGITDLAPLKIHQFRDRN
jgi:hypothetical protein